ncbi:BQ5605_C001g00174 [Microbotryum silenes-dioicae]|uniref:BQ5605_C001g00174 protein n=1 Tax=Microbotryum silenes-dioicae TaxID=796604 RepID=A0A2X0MWZ8_9BASI|nr:BQ5605_C001g00174 [Microbotryum silenes-dioicae]
MTVGAGRIRLRLQLVPQLHPFTPTVLAILLPLPFFIVLYNDSASHPFFWNSRERRVRRPQLVLRDRVAVRCLDRVGFRREGLDSGRIVLDSGRNHILQRFPAGWSRDDARNLATGVRVDELGAARFGEGLGRGGDDAESRATTPSHKGNAASKNVGPDLGASERTISDDGQTSLPRGGV